MLGAAAMTASRSRRRTSSPRRAPAPIGHATRHSSTRPQTRRYTAEAALVAARIRLGANTATAAGDATRTIGLARRSRSGWKRCSLAPLIGSGSPWGPAVSIDPSVLVEGRRMYVYYGAGSGTSIAANLGSAIGVRVYQLPRRHE